jgi:hypothetical protein
MREVATRLPAWRLVTSFELSKTQHKSQGKKDDVVLTAVSGQN